MTKVNRVRVLAEAVAEAFEAAGFTPMALLQGQIGFTELPWAAPPLKLDATLAGLPFSSYLDYPLEADLSAFYDFYSDTLYGLHSDPTKVVQGSAFKGARLALPGSTIGERALRFTIPEGFPAAEPLTGVRFALEAAHVAKISLPCKAVVEEGNSYYVETDFGEIGVAGGFPTLYSDLWDMPYEGDIQDLLTAPRGRVSTACAYDLLARLRSVLFENMNSFVEFDGLDNAIQALRILSKERACLEMLSAVESMSLKAFNRRRKLATIDECIEVMSTWNANDRTKLSVLFEKLVPDVLNMGEYQRKIIDPYRVLPTMLSVKQEKRIVTNLKILRARYAK